MQKHEMKHVFLDRLIAIFATCDEDYMYYALDHFIKDNPIIEPGLDSKAERLLQSEMDTMIRAEYPLTTPWKIAAAQMFIGTTKPLVQQ